MQFSGTTQRLVNRLEEFIQAFRTRSNLVEKHMLEVERAFEYYTDRKKGSLIAQGDKSESGAREFAAEFAGDHRLNDDAVLLSPTDELVSPEEIYARYKGAFVAHLRTLLHDSPEFVWLAGKWFPRSLLVQVNEGQLNIAEAILDMNGGGPLPSEALLPELGLPAEVNRAVDFLLNYAL
jgi:hypothetical protein